MLRILAAGAPDAAELRARLAARGEADFARVEPAVRAIVAAVRAEGDDAVLRYAAQFDRRAPARGALFRRAYGGAEALDRLAPAARAALEAAADRIRAYHGHQKDPGFRYVEDGVELGSRVRPLARVGVYAPGGKARYPSSVLMSAVPASVAGCPEIVLATPLAGDAGDDLVLAAAHLAGVTALVDAGGAQAIAALAYGTASIPRVDKIVGPGNAYVACAKRLVFGAVDIDSIAGPSEILVLADAAADPRAVAADLLSQAEHDEAAYALLATTDGALARAVAAEVEVQLGTLPRAAIARASLEANGAAFVVADRAELAALADELAPEHLALHVGEPEALLESVRFAGAAFVGGMTPEAAGDYLAGPSHVLPTGGAARYASPLGVYDFVVRTSIIRYGADALARQAARIADFARLEGLEGHARAVEVRLPDRGRP